MVLKETVFVVNFRVIFTLIIQASQLASEESCSTVCPSIWVTTDFGGWRSLLG